MPVSQPTKQPELLQFEFLSNFQYPFAELPQGLNVAVERVWKTNKYFWMRLSDPESEASFDFRIVKIYRNPEGTHLAVCPARRWNPKRTLKQVNAMQVVHPGVVSTLTEQELSEFQKSLHMESSFQVISNPDYNSVFEDQLRRTFGQVPFFDSAVDEASLCLDSKFMMGRHLVEAGSELAIDLQTTLNEPGFIKLVQDTESITFRIACAFVFEKSTFVGLRFLPDLADEMDKPPIVLVQLLGKELARTISFSQIGELAAAFMDACEESSKNKD